MAKRKKPLSKMNNRELTAHWTKYASTRLKGKKIVEVRYMTITEAKHWEWYSRPLVIELDDGSLLIPQRDDEGNDGGAILRVLKTKDEIFPVLYR